MLRALRLVPVLCVALAKPAFAAAPAATLRGSPASMVRQNEVARASDYSFLRDGPAVRRMVEKGYLVRVTDGAGYRLANVSFPFARPAVATFIDRLGRQYRAACGERLVVTSLTRPAALQPSNAHRLSVHPAGMAVDLRISGKASCRAWLETTLLSLERRGVLDATRERRPPHYHVAVFPERYAVHAARVSRTGVGAPSRPGAAEPARTAEAAAPRGAGELTPLEAALQEVEDEPVIPAEEVLESPRRTPAGWLAAASLVLILTGLALRWHDHSRQRLAGA